MIDHSGNWIAIELEQAIIRAEMTFRALSLFWRIWLSTSVGLAILFGIVFLLLQERVGSSMSERLEEELRTSLRTYESLWNTRAETLQSMASVIGGMEVLRDAIHHSRPGAVQALADQLWSAMPLSLRETGVFWITDQSGRLLTSFGGLPRDAYPLNLPLVRDAARAFPRQSWGYLDHGGEFFRTIVTPIYGTLTGEMAPVGALVAGTRLNDLAAQRLKEATGGSDELIFLSKDKVVASTLKPAVARMIAANLGAADDLHRINDGTAEYVPLVIPLGDHLGQPAGELCILRSFEEVRQWVSALRRNLILAWAVAVAAGLVMTSWAVRRLVEPVRQLDRAAMEVSRQNYGFRLSTDSRHEFGRVAATFNAMCVSIEEAREESVRQARISTLGRLAGSIVHDLRNPVAAIFGGAEILRANGLSEIQVRHVASTIGRATKRIERLLDDLVHASTGGSESTQLCSLHAILLSAAQQVEQAALAQSVSVLIQVPGDIRLPLQRDRVERVFVNLFANSLEAMPAGGKIVVRGRGERDAVTVEVEDTGPGIPLSIRDAVFRPFSTTGKEGGLGLGLALSRQTLVDHGGDLWLDTSCNEGARFRMRIPLCGPVARVGPITGPASTAAAGD
jgi:signal transduction histidine kinase